MNLYTYVHNNPLTNVDPTGHAPKKTKEDVTSLLASAFGSKPNSDVAGDAVYYNVKSKLGSIAQVYMPSKDNNQFIYLFNMAIGNHYIAAENKIENQEWAQSQLINALSLPADSSFAQLDDVLNSRKEIIKAGENEPLIKDSSTLIVGVGSSVFNPVTGFIVGSADSIIGNHTGTSPSTTAVAQNGYGEMVNSFSAAAFSESLKWSYYDFKFNMQQGLYYIGGASDSFKSSGTPGSVTDAVFGH